MPKFETRRTHDQNADAARWVRFGFGIWDNRKRRIPPRGIVLPLLLTIILAITVLALGFVHQCDLELACSRNLLLRMQMDSLAQSGLEHARGLLLTPQECSQEYWKGDVRQQLVAGSNQFYDVNVVKLSECNYQIISTAYRLDGCARTGCTRLEAELRLDPCIGCWLGRSATIPLQMQIIGDVYCEGSLAINGTIDGDVFTAGTIKGPGRVTGRKHEFAQSGSLDRPDLSIGDFDSHYHIKNNHYPVNAIYTEVISGVHLRPTPMNPAGIHHARGDLHMRGRVEINGMLVVGRDLILEDRCDIVIRAIKNFSAILVGRDVRMQGHGQHLHIEGLAHIGHDIRMGNGIGNTVEITGALCLVAGVVEETTGCRLKIVTAPNKAAILLWQTCNDPKRWSSASGAFFKSIRRN